MNTEEKAKRYDEALEVCKKLYNEAKANEYISDMEDYESIFPELKESEDERIVGIIRSTLESYNRGIIFDSLNTKDYADCLAWLEKQGEKEYDWSEESYDDARLNDIVSKVENGLQLNKAEINWLKSIKEKLHEEIHYWTEEEIEPIISDYLRGTEHYGGMIGRLRCLKPKALEKQAQKPADKVEPKFKVGDWVVYCGKPHQITGLHNDTFTLTSCDGSYFFNNVKSTNEPVFHLWTIQDAKDGDVLVASDNSIFLFKGTIDCACKHYVALTTDGAVKFNKGLEHLWETSIAVHPATKKQRDALMKAMADAGYTFDFEKKELKKIEQKPAAWSEEDEHRIKDTVYFLETAKKHYASTVELDACIDWLKSLRPQSQWKPSEEQMTALRRMKAAVGGEGEIYEPLNSLYDDLKKLREE